MDSQFEHYQEKWNIIVKEYAAAQDKMAAEQKMKANNMFVDFQKETNAAGD